MFNNFYNGSIRKMVVAFGSLFNQIKIDKIESTGWKPMYDLDSGIMELLTGYRMIKNNIYGNV